MSNGTLIPSVTYVCDGNGARRLKTIQFNPAVSSVKSGNCRAKHLRGRNVQHALLGEMGSGRQMHGTLLGSGGV